MRRSGVRGDVWPDEVQELLLQAALCGDDRASAAWSTVRPRISIDELPGELHRLMPLLSKNLAARGVNDPDLSRLKGVYQFSWYRNSLLFRDAGVLLAQLGAADIETMLLRGAAVTVGYRGDLGLRPMNDIDVLVRSADIDHAREVARGAGWRPLVTSQPFERRLYAAPVRNHDGRVVRLHWQPSLNLSLPGTAWDGLWQRAVPARLGDTSTRIPSAADHLVHACADGARGNSGSSLRWIADTTALLQSPAGHVRWDIVVAEAQRLRLSMLVSTALRYLQKALGTTVPASALRALSDTPTTSRDRLAHRLTLTTTPRVASAGEIAGRFLRLTAGMSASESVATVPDYVATVLDTERGHGLPVTVLKRVARAVLSPTPPMALSSKPGSGTVPLPETARRGTN